MLKYVEYWHGRCFFAFAPLETSMERSILKLSCFQGIDFEDVITSLCEVHPGNGICMDCSRAWGSWGWGSWGLEVEGHATQSCNILWLVEKDFEQGNPAGINQIVAEFTTRIWFRQSVASRKEPSGTKVVSLALKWP